MYCSFMKVNTMKGGIIFSGWLRWMDGWMDGWMVVMALSFPLEVARINALSHHHYSLTRTIIPTFMFGVAADLSCFLFASTRLIYATQFSTSPFPFLELEPEPILHEKFSSYLPRPKLDLLLALPPRLDARLTLRSLSSFFFVV